MISAGLHVTDLNLFDGTGEYLVANVQEMREMEETIEKVSIVGDKTSIASADASSASKEVCLSMKKCLFFSKKLIQIN